MESPRYPAKFEGGQLGVGPLITTRMACPGDAMKQEAEFLGALRKAKRYTVEGGALTIFVEGSGEPMKFVEASGKP